jgi:selenocysteine lyase/cysteine desulfurase
MSAGIICFTVNGLSPESTVAELKKRNIAASVSPYKVRYARFTPSYFNDSDDVMHAAEALMHIVQRM